MAITWTDDPDGIDWAEASELYRIAPLGEKDPADLSVVFANSMFRLFAHDDRGRLIGIGRAMADGRDCAYLCDIAVHPDCQGTGLGKQIVARLLELTKGHRKIILYAAPGKEPLYAKFGFRRMKTAMAIFADPARALARGFITED